LWWDVDADSPAAALDMLPDFVADRTQVTAIDDVPIP
jgi:hypothetical protein